MVQGNNCSVRNRRGKQAHAFACAYVLRISKELLRKYSRKPHFLNSMLKDVFPLVLSPGFSLAACTVAEVLGLGLSASIKWGQQYLLSGFS